MIGWPVIRIIAGRPGKAVAQVSTAKVKIKALRSTLRVRYRPPLRPPNRSQ
jgi:hypothetical protein